MPSLLSLFQNQEEVEKPENATVTGDIPNWLNGSYLRVGPGKFDIGDVTLAHFIDGYAMLSKFEITSKGVTFDKKYVKSNAYAKAVEHKQPYFPEFATEGNIASTKNIFSRLANTFSSSDITDNCSINLYEIGSQVYAASETCHVHSINTSTLEAVDKIDFSNSKLFGVHMATAHPIVDSNGDWWNIGTSFKTGCKYQVLKVPALKNNKLSPKDAFKDAYVFATISPSWSTYFSYYHTFAMTENYIILIEQPLIMSIVKMTKAKLDGKSIRDIMEWTPSEKNRFHVVDKRSGEVLKTKYVSDVPFFFFHLINSYEDGNFIVIDVDAYPSNEVMNKMSISRLRSGDLDQKDPSKITRFVLPAVRNAKVRAKEVYGDNLVDLAYTTASAIRDSNSEVVVLKGEEIGQPGFEGPVINPLKMFKKHKYVYGSGSMLPGFYANALCKIDVESGESLLWRDNEFVFPGEPKFIPNPKNNEEDDGVIITTCSDLRSKTNDYLVFIDPKNMKELGRAYVKSQIPQSLHGLFIKN